MREAKNVEDFANRGKIRPTLNCGILNHAASVYTREIFQKFQVEFLMLWYGLERALQFMGAATISL